MSRRARVPGCLAFGKGLRHSLAFVHTLHRRCVVNRETVIRVASQLGLDHYQVKGTVRLLKSISYIPSFERLALIAQRDPGLDDEDIGEMFGKTGEWSAEVRERAAELRQREKIPMKCEILTDMDFVGDDIESLAAEARTLRPLAGRQMEAGRMGNIRCYQWGTNGTTLVPAGIE